MTIDVTLYEIYSELGVLEIMQTDEAQEFIKEESELAWEDSQEVVAA